MIDLFLTPLVGFAPFAGVSPSLGPFARILSNPITVILGLIWALAFVYCAVKLVTGFITLAKARDRGHVQAEVEAKNALAFPAVAIVGLSAVAPLFGIITGLV